MADPVPDPTEAQARAYCTSLNIDPDQMIGPEGNQKPMWQNAVPGLRTVKLQLVALGVAVPNG